MFQAQGDWQDRQTQCKDIPGAAGRPWMEPVVEMCQCQCPDLLVAVLVLENVPVGRKETPKHSGGWVTMTATYSQMGSATLASDLLDILGQVT